MDRIAQEIKRIAREIVSLHSESNDVKKAIKNLIDTYYDSMGSYDNMSITVQFCLSDDRHGPIKRTKEMLLDEDDLEKIMRAL
jgi:hypothetical protein